MAGPGSAFITKFAVMLGASPLQFGLLSATGQLSQVFQLLGAALAHSRASRKKSTIISSVISRIIAFLFGFLPFFLDYSTAIWVFLGLFFIAVSSQAVAGNLWIGWISDLIPPRFRGRFFSRRSQILMLVGLLAGFILGAFIDLFAESPGALAANVLDLVKTTEIFAPANLKYALIAAFSIAVILGLWGMKYLAIQPERAIVPSEEKVAEMMFSPFKDPNFRKLLVYGSWWMLAVGIGAPFWQPFMIKNLGMSLLEIQLYSAISTAASFFSLGFWGKLIDRFGNKTCMRAAIVLGGVNPLIWLFLKPNSYWLIYIEAASSGCMWAGAGIIAVNFVLSIAPTERRQIYSGVFGAFTGIGMMITMVLSGALMPKSLDIFGLQLEPEQVLFALTGVARWTAEIPLSWVVEHRSKGFGDFVFYVLDFTKVQIARLAFWKYIK